MKTGYCIKTIKSVSYTHLDVYKRQTGHREDRNCLVTVHCVPVTCINPLKIACGNGIYAPLHHFLTYCAVNAQC